MKSREGMSGFLSAFESWQVLMKRTSESGTLRVLLAFIAVGSRMY
jgi:hypothetical protein